MKIVFRYTRLPKKRGGWRYPLRVTLKAEYSSEEEERFNPTFGLKYSTTTCPSDCPDWWQWVSEHESVDLSHVWQPHNFELRGSRDVSGESRVAIDISPMDDEVLYCLTSDIRERVIQLLHDAYTAFCGKADAWWDASAPEPGDAVPTVLEHVVGNRYYGDPSMGPGPRARRLA